MNPKMYVAAAAGAIISAALLWYPLAEYFPSTFVPGWAAGNASLAWVLVFAALAVIALSGAGAARMSGTASRLGAAVSGAVAGAICGLTGYVTVAGAAAGAWGARPILLSGLQPVSESELIRILVDSITGIHWWVMFVLWGMLLVGGLLGFVGGWLAGPGGEPDPDMPLIYQVTGVGGMLTGVLVLVVSTAVLALLVPTMERSLEKYGLISAYAPESVIVFPAVTIFMMMFGSQLLWWAFYRRGRAAGQLMDMQVRMSVIVLLAAPIICLAIMAFMYPAQLFYTLYLPLLIVSILVSVLIFRDVWPSSQSAWNNTLTFHIGIWASLLTYGLMLFGSYIGTLPASLADVMMPVVAIEPLTTASGTAPDAVGMVREHFNVYRNTGLSMTLLLLPFYALATSGMVLGLMRLLEALSRRKNQPV